MRTKPLNVKCPQCESDNVVYSCEPECCFNHVCGDCLASFQLATRDLGARLEAVLIDRVQRDSCSPTVRCSRCASLNVVVIENAGSAEERLVCADCLELLELCIV